MNIPNYISPENRKEVDELMKPLREAETREDRDNARKEINSQFSEDSRTAWSHLTKEEEEEKD